MTRYLKLLPFRKESNFKQRKTKNISSLKFFECMVKFCNRLFGIVKWYRVRYSEKKINNNSIVACKTLQKDLDPLPKARILRLINDNVIYIQFSPYFRTMIIGILHRANNSKSVNNYIQSNFHMLNNSEKKIQSEIAVKMGDRVFVFDEVLKKMFCAYKKCEYSLTNLKSFQNNEKKVKKFLRLLFDIFSACRNSSTIILILNTPIAYDGQQILLKKFNFLYSVISSKDAGRRCRKTIHINENSENCSTDIGNKNHLRKDDIIKIPFLMEECRVRDLNGQQPVISENINPIEIMEFDNVEDTGHQLLKANTDNNHKKFYEDKFPSDTSLLTKQSDGNSIIRKFSSHNETISSNILSSFSHSSHMYAEKVLDVMPVSENENSPLKGRSKESFEEKLLREKIGAAKTFLLNQDCEDTQDKHSPRDEVAKEIGKVVENEKTGHTVHQIYINYETESKELQIHQNQIQLKSHSTTVPPVNNLGNDEFITVMEVNASPNFSSSSINSDEKSEYFNQVIEITSNSQIDNCPLEETLLNQECITYDIHVEHSPRIELNAEVEKDTEVEKAENIIQQMHVNYETKLKNLQQNHIQLENTSTTMPPVSNFENSGFFSAMNMNLKPSHLTTVPPVNNLGNGGFITAMDVNARPSFSSSSINSDEKSEYFNQVIDVTSNSQIDNCPLEETLLNQECITYDIHVEHSPRIELNGEVKKDTEVEKTENIIQQMHVNYETKAKKLQQNEIQLHQNQIYLKSHSTTVPPVNNLGNGGFITVMNVNASPSFSSSSINSDGKREYFNQAVDITSNSRVDNCRLETTLQNQECITCDIHVEHSPKIELNGEVKRDTEVEKTENMPVNYKTKSKKLQQNPIQLENPSMTIPPVSNFENSGFFSVMNMNVKSSFSSSNIYYDKMSENFNQVIDITSNYQTDDCASETILLNRDGMIYDIEAEHLPKIALDWEVKRDIEIKKTENTIKQMHVKYGTESKELQQNHVQLESHSTIAPTINNFENDEIFAASTMNARPYFSDSIINFNEMGEKFSEMMDTSDSQKDNLDASLPNHRCTIDDTLTKHSHKIAVDEEIIIDVELENTEYAVHHTHVKYENEYTGLHQSQIQLKTHSEIAFPMSNSRSEFFSSVDMNTKPSFHSSTTNIDEITENSRKMIDSAPSSQIYDYSMKGVTKDNSKIFTLSDASQFNKGGTINNTYDEHSSYKINAIKNNFNIKKLKELTVEYMSNQVPLNFDPENKPCESPMISSDHSSIRSNLTNGEFSAVKINSMKLNFHDSFSREKIGESNTLMDLTTNFETYNYLLGNNNNFENCLRTFDARVFYQYPATNNELVPNNISCEHNLHIQNNTKNDCKIRNEDIARTEDIIYLMSSKSEVQNQEQYHNLSISRICEVPSNSLTKPSFSMRNYKILQSNDHNSALLSERWNLHSRGMSKRSDATTSDKQLSTQASDTIALNADDNTILPEAYLKTEPSEVTEGNQFPKCSTSYGSTDENTSPIDPKSEINHFHNNEDPVKNEVCGQTPSVNFCCDTATESDVMFHAVETKCMDPSKRRGRKRKLFMELKSDNVKRICQILEPRYKMHCNGSLLQTANALDFFNKNAENQTDDSEIDHKISFGPETAQKIIETIELRPQRAAKLKAISQMKKKKV